MNGMRPKPDAYILMVYTIDFKELKAVETNKNVVYHGIQNDPNCRTHDDLRDVKMRWGNVPYK